MTIEVDIEVDATAAEVWAVLGDVTLQPEWIQSVDRVGNDDDGVFEVAHRLGPLRLSCRSSVLERLENERLSIDHAGDFSGSSRFTLTPHGSRTTLTWREERRSKVSFRRRVASAALQPVLRRSCRASLVALKALVEDALDGRDPDPQIGALLGTGRDGEVREFGRRWVMRPRSDGGDQRSERELMQWVRDHGYPVPEVVEYDDPTCIVMERVDGPSMLDDLGARPWKALSHARLLADLHTRLDDVPPPPGLRHSGAGDRLLHLDLHPDNVIMGADGPVVIDWTNAAIGDRGLDRALTWILLKTGEVDGNPVMRSLVGALRERFARAFEVAAGEVEIAAHATTAAELKLLDPNMRASEQRAIFELARDIQDRPTHSRTDDV